MLTSRVFLWKKALKLRATDMRSLLNLLLTIPSDLLAYSIGGRRNPISLLGGTYLVPIFEGKAIFSVRPMTDDLYFIIPEREPIVEKELKRLFNNARGFIDVGANVGYYTIAAALSGLEVLAIEPIDSTASVLEKNILLNGISHKVKVVRAAAWSERTTLTFNVSQYLLGQATTRSDLAGSEWELKKVNALTIDDLSDNLPNPLVIKVDAEGSEVEILKGASKTLERTSALVLEVSLGNLDKIKQLLKEFKVKPLGGNYYLAER